jgi:hypothetical protein
MASSQNLLAGGVQSTDQKQNKKGVNTFRIRVWVWVRFRFRIRVRVRVRVTLARSACFLVSILRVRTDDAVSERRSP